MTRRSLLTHFSNSFFRTTEVRDGKGKLLGFLRGNRVTDEKGKTLGSVRNQKTYDQHGRLLCDQPLPGFLLGKHHAR